jgi:hypothetical protein
VPAAREREKGSCLVFNKEAFSVEGSVGRSSSRSSGSGGVSSFVSGYVGENLHFLFRGGSVERGGVGL